MSQHCFLPNGLPDPYGLTISRIRSASDWSTSDATCSLTFNRNYFYYFSATISIVLGWTWDHESRVWTIKTKWDHEKTSIKITEDQSEPLNAVFGYWKFSLTLQKTINAQQSRPQLSHIFSRLSPSVAKSSRSEWKYYTCSHSALVAHWSEQKLAATCERSFKQFKKCSECSFSYASTLNSSQLFDWHYNNPRISLFPATCVPAGFRLARCYCIFNAEGAP